MQNDRLRDSLNALRERFGIERVEVQDSVIDRVAAVLIERGHVANVVSLRHGMLLIRCTPVVATLLRYDLEQVRLAVESTHPGMVTDISLTTRELNS